MKKIIIYLLFIFISTNSYAQFYSVNISYPLDKTKEEINNDDLKIHPLDGVKFGLSKSYLSSKYFDGQINLFFVSYSFKETFNYFVYGDSLAQTVYRGSDIKLSHQFKRNIFGNFSVFIEPCLTLPISTSFKNQLVDTLGQVGSTDSDYRGEVGNLRFDHNYGISFLSDNLINFELGFNLINLLRKDDYPSYLVRNRNAVYLTVGYAIKY
jgi:hypothetical protein